jgi:hypothetical protein
MILALCCAICGCKKSQPPAETKTGATNTVTEPSKAGTPNASDPVARLHWVGKKKLAADTNSAYLMTIWNMPESAKLEEQTLNKLAIAPWLSTFSNRPPVITNYDVVVAGHPAASLLRPLLDDLLQEEWHLEVRSAESGVQSGEPPKGSVPIPGSGTAEPAQGTPASAGQAELTLAIRLDPNREALWRTNLSKVFDSFPSNSALPTPHSALSFSRTGPWTIVRLAAGPTIPADELLRRMGTDTAGGGALGSGWLDGNLDLPRLSAALGWNLPEAWPKLNLAITGDGQNVRTRAQFDFAKPLALEIEPWNIPTNLIHDPLIGFMAIRGIRPLLEKFKPWTDLQLGTAPNQAFFWAQGGLPSMHFVVAPSNDASNQVHQLADIALNKVNPMIESNRLGTFRALTNGPGVIWYGMPWMSPRLDAVDTSHGPAVFAGFAKLSASEKPWPDALGAQLGSGTNLLVYDWEITGGCLQGLTQMGQMVRNVFARARLTHTASIEWLIAIQTKLGNSVTALNITAPSSLNLSRTSAIGFTAAELQLIADWLESPDFPSGSHTFEAPGSQPIMPLRRHTNSATVLPVGALPQTGPSKP